MASLQLDPSSGRYRVRFYFEGREYKRSLRTKHRRVAQSALGQVEETLRMLQLGLTEVPAGVDEGAFIVSGARLRKTQRPRSEVQTLEDLFRVYERDLPEGSKEARTLAGEKLHFKHLLRHLKPKTKLTSIKPTTIQQYVERRSKDQFRKRCISPDTIKKELTTLRLVWNWAKRQEHVETPPPLQHVVLPKRDERAPFMTMAEIRRVLKSKSNKRPEKELWESLYLTREEVDRLLKHVKSQDCEPFVYPMFVLAAHTGMRRSELLRSEASDLDFDGRTISVREKKRSRKHAISYRRAPMSGLLGRVFHEYFNERAGTGYTLQQQNGEPLTIDAADYHFEAALKASEWEPVRGFHTLRHSFASNATAEGVDQRMIDAWMGHQTEEMRQRYRHLAPEQQQKAIDSVFAKEEPLQWSSPESCTSLNERIGLVRV